MQLPYEEAEGPRIGDRRELRLEGRLHLAGLKVIARDAEEGPLQRVELILLGLEDKLIHVVPAVGARVDAYKVPDELRKCLNDILGCSLTRGSGDLHVQRCMGARDLMGACV